MDKTYCIFGDSVTQAAYIKDGWVGLLKSNLEEKYWGSFVNVFNLGVGGNTTNDILKRFDQEAAARMPTTTIFAIGVNDSAYFQDVSKPIVEEKTFEDNLIKMIDLATKFSKDITFIGPVLGDDSILKPSPDGEESDQWWYDRSRVETYDKILEKIAQLRKCRFVRLLNILDPNDFEDGLHPNEQGHRKMFDVIKGYF